VQAWGSDISNTTLGGRGVKKLPQFGNDTAPTQYYFFCFSMLEACKSANLQKGPIYMFQVTCFYAYSRNFKFLEIGPNLAWGWMGQQILPVTKAI